jgi:hypothetical protein
MVRKYDVHRPGAVTVVTQRSVSLT